MYRAMYMHACMHADKIIIIMHTWQEKMEFELEEHGRCAYRTRGRIPLRQWSSRCLQVLRGSNYTQSSCKERQAVKLHQKLQRGTSSSLFPG